MGKAVPKAIKMRVEILLRELPDRFSTDFEKNKQALDSLNLKFSKFDRNLMAAFVTRKMRKRKKA